MRTPSDVPQALALISQRPSPALIWYHQDERVELSGRVLVNWVEKAAGLLVDQLDVEAHSPVTVAPTPHWRQIILSLAALRVGARLQLSPQPVENCVVYSDTESHLDDTVDSEWLLAVAEPALAFECEEPVTEPVVDFCAQVRAFPDHYVGSELPDGSDVALLNANIFHGDLLSVATAAASSVTNPSGTSYLPLNNGWNEHALLTVLGILVAGGAVVVSDTPEAITDSVLAQEMATRESDA